MRSQRGSLFIINTNHLEGFPRVREFNLKVYALNPQIRSTKRTGLDSFNRWATNGQQNARD